MGAIASQIASLTIVYSIVYSDADQRNHQSLASLAFCADRWIPRTNGQLRGKCFHLMTSSWFWRTLTVSSRPRAAALNLNEVKHTPLSFGTLLFMTYICMLNNISLHQIAVLYGNFIKSRLSLDHNDKYICTQYFPSIVHSLYVFVCLVVVRYRSIYPHPSALLHWHWGNYLCVSMDNQSIYHPLMI